jgi:hypothetical protein
MKDCIRHGDVFLRPIARDEYEKRTAPSEHRYDPCFVTPRKSKVILEGEVTGHAHRILEGEAVILDYYEKTWRSEQPTVQASYLQVDTPTIITHEEHGPLPVLPGLYEIIRAREFDYAQGLGRNVWD